MPREDKEREGKGKGGGGHRALVGKHQRKVEKNPKWVLWELPGSGGETGP